MDKLLDVCLSKSKGHIFYSFSNNNGKRWIIPVLNMRTAMSLYQPSGLKGKLLKRVFPNLYRIKKVRQIIGAEEITCSLKENIYQLFCNIFHISNVEFSVFCGTPCVHQKMTIQLSNGERILGYCKVSDKGEIKAIFDKEKHILAYLFQKGMDAVPQCLYCGSLTNEVDIFVQSTIKTKYSKIPHKWSVLQEQFLEDLYNRTKRTIFFEQTDFYESIMNLKEHVSVFLPAESVILKQAIDSVLNIYEGKEVEFSAYHADFTPWNMFIEKNKLFVFDWEYAQLTYPPRLDYFHFFMQTSIFEKHLDSMRIWKFYKKNQHCLVNKYQDVSLAFLCYLLGIMAQYVERENGVFEGDVKRNMEIWISLIMFLQKDMSC